MSETTQEDDWRREGRWNPRRSFYADGSSRSLLHPKVSVFFLFLFLLSVYMSLNNIRYAVKVLPDTNAFDEYATQPEEISTKERLKGVSSSGKKNRPNTFGNSADTAASSENSTAITSTVPSQTPPLLTITPNANNTVITIVSMGRLVDTFQAELCIRSIRRRGLFTGFIMLFTDKIGYNRYKKSILSWDNRTIIISGHDEDMNPREENKGEFKLYAQPTMIFKRFKTHHSKYIAEYAALLDSIRFAMYLDVDILVGNRVDTFFEDYTKMVAVEYQRANNDHQRWKSNTTLKLGDDVDKNIFSFVGMFRDTHLKSKMHSGCIIWDLDFEERCQNAWRNEMDTYWDKSDQTMFIRVLEDYDKNRCTVFPLPHQHMTFATRGLMRDATEARQKLRKKRRGPLRLPTFMHVTNYRLKRINNDTIHNEYLRYVLDLKDNESMTDGISWENAVSFKAKRKE